MNYKMITAQEPAVEFLEGGSIKSKVYSRIGLLGNPSDGYYGKCLALSLANFWAEVTLEPSEKLEFKLNPLNDPLHFTNIQAVADHISGHGYYGAVRLLMAAVKKIADYCASNAISIDSTKNFTLTYRTTIPRQRGLSGSSALICAAINCLIAHYSLEDAVPVGDRPALVLAAESELGITAGLMDRVIQVYGGLVYMDFNDEDMREHGRSGPRCRSLDPGTLPPLYLIYSEAPSGKDSGVVHSDVRQRWQDGDRIIINRMRETANLAAEGLEALETRNVDQLASLLRHGFVLRRMMFGDAVLGADNIDMVEIAAGTGAGATFTGSGGAVVAVCPEGEHQVAALREECARKGLLCVAVEVGPVHHLAQDAVI